MQPVYFSKQTKAYLAFVMAVAVFTLLPVEAQAKISDLFTNVGNEAPLLTTQIVKILALIGLICVVIGIVGFMTRHKSQVPAGVSASFFIGGIILLGIIQFTTEGIDTLFNSTTNSGLSQITGKS